MEAFLVQTHDEDFEISGITLWDIILGSILAWPLGLPNLIAYD